jgi:antitoxin component YwqK of YwqJK toxin-antitoxin module
MQNNTHCAIFSLAMILLFQFSCKENLIETVESHDDEGRLERYQRNKKDFAKEGVYQKLSADGKLLEEAHYHQNLLEGERKYYYPGGSVESIETYKAGQYQGKYRKFYENGTPRIEQEYVDGALQGLSIKYYPNGAVEERVTMKDNEENGPFQEYYDNGNLKTEGSYAPFESESALEQGELKEYDENGQVVRIADCVNGRCTTRWKK